MSSKEMTTRDRILRACLDLMEKGASSRMSDIAKAAGVSRQALYLHFTSRAELLVEVTFYLDRIYGTEVRLAPSRAAKNGRERLRAFLTAWADYLPLVAPTLRALTAMSLSDAEASTALTQRMTDLHEGCEAAIAALSRDGVLSSDFSIADASDLLWAMCQVDVWYRLTQMRGWSQDDFTKHLLTSAERLFATTVKET